jgi:outer membrane protein TolC
VVVNRKDSWGRAFDKRPDYQQQKITLEQQKVTLRYNRNQLFPQLDLSGSYGVTGRSTEAGPAINELANRNNPNYSWGIKLTIPLDNLSARNSYKKAKLQQEQLLLKFKQTEQSIMIQIDNDIRAVESAAEKIKATRQAREYAEAALDAEQKKLESGKSTNYQVLQFQRDLTTAQTAEISALSDYNKALTQLAHDEGSTLDRHSIKVDLR